MKQLNPPPRPKAKGPLRFHSCYSLFLFILFTLSSLHAQQAPAPGAPNPGIPIPPGYEGADLETLRAREEFRLGVQAYNRLPLPAIP
ncbi:MAG: hypothetical protein LBH42_10815 [Treponema sp.]|jgi:hypothetical protein|nr:hypothetical protein [Treponema sp.]